ncbi:MAG: hypothetical protein NT062_18965 [Proteobacteria bacterium]|nr:hypothetical protein [Pseudomonadota bacterium]
MYRAIRLLHAEGWLARVIDGPTHKALVFQAGSSSLSTDEYVAQLWKQLMLRAAPPRDPNAKTTPPEDPVFRWLATRARGSAEALTRIGREHGPANRARTLAEIVRTATTRQTKWLKTYVKRRVRAARPREVPASAQAVRDALVAEAATLPTSNGSQYYAPFAVRVGVVTDDVLLHAIEDTATFVRLGPADAGTAAMDMFLFVACWQGGGAWPKIGVPGSTSRRQLHAAIERLNLRGIPTVFWSIEDPPHYHDFVDIAQRCSHVYTTAAETVDAYRRDCGNSQVGVWPFAVSPRAHHPIGSGRLRRPAMFFAGSWYRQYPEREVDMANVFDGVLAAGRELIVADRCYVRGNPGFDFPPIYRPYTYPPIDHAPLQQVQKLFDWCLNFSSVKHSPTMLANRVPELLAQGAAVISNYSRSADLRYPSVFTLTDAGQVGDLVSGLHGPDLRAHQQLGVRTVFEGHTYVDALAQVCEDVGLAVSRPTRRVLIIADQVTEAVRATLAAQTLTEPHTLIAADQLTPAALADHDFVTWWPADAGYGAFHLQDQLHAFKYTNARYVRTGTPAHEFTDEVLGKRGVLFAARELAFDQLRGELAGQLPGGYVVPSVDELTPIDDPGEPAQLTIVVAQRDQAVRVWSKIFLPARRGPGRPAVDLLLLDDDSTDATSRAWLRRMARHPGVRVAPAAGTWAAHVATPYVLVVDVDDMIVFGALAQLVPALATAPAGALVVTELLDLGAVSRRSDPEAARVKLRLVPATRPPTTTSGVIVPTELLVGLAGQPLDVATLVARAPAVVGASISVVASYGRKESSR